MTPEEWAAAYRPEPADRPDRGQSHRWPLAVGVALLAGLLFAVNMAVLWAQA